MSSTSPAGALDDGPGVVFAEPGNVHDADGAAVPGCPGDHGGAVVRRPRRCRRSPAGTGAGVTGAASSWAKSLMTSLCLASDSTLVHHSCQATKSRSTMPAVMSSSPMIWTALRRITTPETGAAAGLTFSCSTTRSPPRRLRWALVWPELQLELAASKTSDLTKSAQTAGNFLLAGYQARVADLDSARQGGHVPESKPRKKTARAAQPSPQRRRTSPTPSGSSPSCSA